MGNFGSSAFNQDFLRREGTSDQFFAAISYPVELDGLYKLKTSCYYHEAMEYCPVIVEIVNQELKDHYQGNFLLQAWSKEGHKVYEKVLKFQIRSWSIFSELLCFILDPQEEGSEYIYTVNLTKGNSMLKVQDFCNDQTFVKLGICNLILYVANDTTIKMVDINCPFQNGKELVIKPKDQEILTYEIDHHCKIHGFFENKYSKEQKYLLTIIETDDNQIDFSRLYFYSRQISKGDIAFRQYTEVVKRAVRFDPIIDFQQVILKNQIQYGVALRQSGEVDFYWNFTRVNSSGKDLFHDIAINFESIYLRKKNEETRAIALSYGTRIGLQVSQSVKITQQDWDRLFHQKLASQFNFYPSFCLINTSFFLAHGNIVSLFDIISKKWVKHFFVQQKVIKVFRNEKDDEIYNLGVYLSDGQINLIDIQGAPNDSQLSWEMQLGKYHTEGEILKISADIEHFRMLYIFTAVDKDKINFYGFCRDSLIELNSFVEDLSKDTIILSLFSPQERTEFVLLNQDSGDLRIYQHYWEKNENGELSFYIFQRRNFKLSMPEELGKLHTVAMSNSEEHMIIFDQSNFYVYDLLTKQLVNTFYDQNIVGLQFVDDSFFYTMVNKNQSQDQQQKEELEQGGFCVQDLSQILDKEKSEGQMLQQCIVGINKVVDFSQENQRLSYMVDYQRINIVPLLHRNVINFMGMQSREHYISARKVKNQFIALDRQNQLSSWNSLTGKLNQVLKLPESQDYSQFNIFTYEPNDISYKMLDWNSNRTLLMSQNANSSITDEDFFDPDMLKTSLSNNKPFIKIVPKKYHLFKLIEILDERNVKEHLSFYHPFYGSGHYQRLYISDDTNYMLERLVNQRVFLYRRECVPMTKNEGNTKLCQWKLVRRLEQWPMDLSECTFANYLCSPNLMYYLDYDREKNKFVIKESFNQRTYCEIPTGLMNPQEDKPVNFARKFKWLDSKTIKLINNDGIEKIIEIQQQKTQSDVSFKELSVSALPFYDNSESYRHFYFFRNPSKLNDTEKRLKYKQQKYKSAYYLENNSSTWQIIHTLFDIDSGIDNCKYKYVADLSFTYLHWKLIEKIGGRQNFQISSIDQNTLRLMSLNILPYGNTALHQACKKHKTLKDLYNFTDSSPQRHLDIPFIANFDHQSPLDLCLRNNDVKTADLFLQKLASAPLDHHGRAVFKALPEAIKLGLPSIGNYLESRFIQTEQLKLIKRGAIVKKHGKFQSVVQSSLWGDPEISKKQLFENSPLQSDVKVEFLDLPMYHCYKNHYAYEFFDALAQSQDIELFSKRSIQTILDYKWHPARHFMIWRRLIPFIFFYIAFYIYSNFQYIPQVKDQSNSITDSLSYAFGCTLILFCGFFLKFEINVIRQFGLGYLFQFWNYVSLIPIIIIPILVVSNFFNYDNSYYPTLHAFTSLLMWIKFLYFMRIFKNTGYLIRMLFEVIRDIKIFLIVLIIVISGFAEAFYILSSQQKDPLNEFAGQDFISSFIYTYRNSLGDFQVDAFADIDQPITVHILFVILTILVLIVMLNLLIAILSESFSKVNRYAVQASYQERARIIFETSQMLPDSFVQSYLDDEKYLLVARDLEEDDKIEDFSVLAAMDNIKANMRSNNAKLSNQIQETRAQIETIQKQLSDQTNQKQERLEEIEKTLKRLVLNVQDLNEYGFANKPFSRAKNAIKGLPEMMPHEIIERSLGEASSQNKHKPIEVLRKFRRNAIDKVNNLF